MPVVAIVAVAVCSTLAGVSNAFTGDDIPLIRDNQLVHSLANLAVIFRSPYWPPPAPPDLYRPLTSVLLALQWVAGLGSPTAFRVVSIAMYAAAGVAVFHLARRILPRHYALAVGVLFAAHPVHTEAVALGVNQSELVVGLILAIATTVYIDRRRDSRLSTTTWFGLVVLYAAAALVKEHALILPALFVAAELTLIRAPSLTARVRGLWPGYAALILVAVVVLLVRTRVLAGNTIGSFTAEALVGSSMAGRALTMLQVIPQWIRLLAWPAHLRIDYSPGELVRSTNFGLHESLGVAVLLSLVVATVASWRRLPIVAFGLLWFGLSLLPVSNVFVPTGVLLAERTLFLPSIGFLVACAGTGEALLHRWPAMSHQKSLAVAAAVAVMLGTVRSAMRMRIWHDPQTLAMASVRDAPRSWRVQRAYGEALFDTGQPREGVQAYVRSIQWAPEPWFVRNSLSRRLRMIGDDAAAVEQLRESLRERPGQREATAELAAALLGVGRYADARRLADSVIAVENAPPIMLWLRRLADSAAAVGAPPGTVKLGVRGP